MQLIRVEIETVFLVEGKSIFIPGIPKAHDDVVEFGRTFIAQGMIDMAIEPEIESFLLVLRSDKIPAGTTLADVVDRGEPPGDVIRLVIGRCSGSDQSQIFGDCGECRKQSSSARI